MYGNACRIILHQMSKAMMKKLVLLCVSVTTIAPQLLKAQRASVTIGSQVWMLKNLNVGVFSNGDTIPQARTNAEWIAAGNNKRPAWCYYNNDSTGSNSIGRLYNWYAVSDSRGLAPAGWHIPTKDELTNLSSFLGGSSASGEKLKSTSGWANGGNGSNSSGFTAVPSGLRSGYDGTFMNRIDNVYWWSSTSSDVNNAHIRALNAMDGNPPTWTPDGFFYHMPWDKVDGLSVRCLKN
jgi:uncharacterized protein (TIGR02145 family)